MGKVKPVNVIVVYPSSKEIQQEIKRFAARFQANAIAKYLEKLNCPNEQKIKLIDAVIKNIKEDM